MKTLLVCEVREGKLRESAYELLAFAEALGGEREVLLVGDEAQAPRFDGKLYVAAPGARGEYDPARHRELVIEAVRRSGAGRVVLVHSSYGWDLAPRVAAALGATQVSDVVAVGDGGFEVGCCNGKMRRLVSPRTGIAVLTIQPGAFLHRGDRSGVPTVERI